MMEELIVLAERCETAERPDRELNREIALALGWTPQEETGLKETDPARHYWLDQHGCINNEPKGWTSSIDAALTLVPSPAEYPNSKTFLIDCATQTSQFGQPVAYVWNDQGKHMGKGRSPALALCAASLRAQSAALTENAP